MPPPLSKYSKSKDPEPTKPSEIKVDQHTKRGKLKFYCDTCKKQCGDKLGFERHCESNIHLKMMEWVRDHPMEYIQQKSDEFEAEFMECLKKRSAGAAIEANILYQDVISNPHHTHMKSTKWETLTDLVRYLDTTKKAKVDYIEGKGWFLTYIELNQEVAERKRIAAITKSMAASAFQTRQRELYGDENEPATVAENLTLHKASTSAADGRVNLNVIYKPSVAQKGSVFDENDDENDMDDEIVSDASKTDKSVLTDSINTGIKRKLADDTYYDENNQTAPKSTLENKEESNMSDEDDDDDDNNNRPWLRKGLIVKILNKQLENGTYYGKKGEIVQIYTSINKQLIPIDVNYAINHAADLRSPQTPANGDDSDENDDENIVTNKHTDERFCLNYEYTLICQVLLNVLNPDYDEKDPNSMKYIPTKVLLPQSQVETTLPRFKCESNNQKHEVALVSSKYCPSNTEKLIYVDVIDINLDNNTAKVILIDKYYRDNAITLKNHTHFIDQERGVSYYKNTVRVLCDDICSTIYT